MEPKENLIQWFSHEKVHLHLGPHSLNVFNSEAISNPIPQKSTSIHILMGIGGMETKSSIFVCLERKQRMKDFDFNLYDKSLQSRQLLSEQKWFLWDFFKK